MLLDWGPHHDGASELRAFGEQRNTKGIGCEKGDLGSGQSFTEAGKACRTEEAGANMRASQSPGLWLWPAVCTAVIEAPADPQSHWDGEGRAVAERRGRGRLRGPEAGLLRKVQPSKDLYPAFPGTAHSCPCTRV